MKCPICGSIHEPATTCLAAATAHSTAATVASDRVQASDLGLLGRVLEGYCIGELLGCGGMGSVFRARQLELGRDVAIKILHGASETEIERFRREARGLARVQSPHIVDIHQIFESSGRLCIAMRLVEGGSVRTLLQRRGRLTPALAAEIARQAALGLWHAAAEGVTHRDIKPDNLLLSRSGQVRIADFGVAHVRDESSRLTVEGTLLGTPAYMSPEQWNDSRSSDHRSDLYSLGCTLFEMLVGERPFRGPTNTNYMKQHCLDPAPDLRDEWPEVPMTLAEVVARLLQKDPAQRFQTGQELADALLPSCAAEGLAAAFPKRGEGEVPVTHRAPAVTPTAGNADLHTQRAAPVGRWAWLLALLLGLLGLLLALELLGVGADPAPQPGDPKHPGPHADTSQVRGSREREALLVRLIQILAELRKVEQSGLREELARVDLLHTEAHTITGTDAGELEPELAELLVEVDTTCVKIRRQNSRVWVLALEHQVVDLIESMQADVQDSRFSEVEHTYQQFEALLTGKDEDFYREAIASWRESAERWRRIALELRQASSLAIDLSGITFEHRTDTYSAVVNGHVLRDGDFVSETSGVFIPELRVVKVEQNSVQFRFRDVTFYWIMNLDKPNGFTWVAGE